MKKTFLSLLGIAACAIPTHAQLLYLTADTTSIRTSTDSGINWSAWVTDGTNLRGIAVDSSSGIVFVNDRGAGTSTARPLYAYTSNGTQLATTTFDTTGGFNQLPVGYFNGYVYQNAGLAGGVSGQSTGLSAWNGSTFGSSPLTSAAAGNWQGNDIGFASNSGTDYLYITGTSGPGVRRYTIGAGGALSLATNITITGPTANNVDFSFTLSGRLVTLDTAGIWVSGTGQIASTSISLTNAFAFSLTENIATGDMGANARDFAILGNNIYAVTNTNIFRYTLDDTTGTITFDSANAHGFNSANVQIAAIPEPSSIALLAGGLTALVVYLRRRQS